ncbi:SIS domain-containing protein [Nocardioides mesophilus]|uniref:SIS domain-containing protein n=1 Tax=Nocardioides mesophilus TaxID=433659 RepID=A0A7G9RBP6_9ACTN|nr:SIS domain-containing protein [Nocardioides mesophilus]QNN53021.1 SIS domain-containing protein [Nocardioides mesophilus]
MTRLEDEMHEQPEAAARLLTQAWPLLDELAAVVRGPGTAGVVIVARGTSDNAARYAQYLWGLRHGLPVALATPSLVSVYGRRLELRHHSVVAISQSGSSPDIVRFVETARADGRPTLAVTNEAGSELAAAAGHVLALAAEPERSVAATKTYTTSLLAVALLSHALAGRDPSEAAEVRRVPEALHAAVDGTRGVDAAARLLSTYDRAVCVGRGVNLATAHETALKLTELTGTLVMPFSPADLLHGPIAAVGPDAPAVLIAPDEPASASVLGLLPELRRRGAPVIVVGDASARPVVEASGPVGQEAGPGGPPAPVLLVELPPEAALPGWLTPITAVVAGQLLARRVAELRGVDLDHPGELTKVTRTW